MKRLNRKKLITQFEELRQGFKDAIDFGNGSDAFSISMQANHKYANSIIVELGGESVPPPNKKEIDFKLWSKANTFYGDHEGQV